MALYLGLVVGATGLNLKIGHLPPVPAYLWQILWQNDVLKGLKP
jgi:hypothetical protein